MKTLTTLLARIVLHHIRKVDPKVLARLKRELDSFNARTKVWQDSKVTVSESK